MRMRMFLLFAAAVAVAVAVASLFGIAGIHGRVLHLGGRGVQDKRIARAATARDRRVGLGAVGQVDAEDLAGGASLGNDHSELHGV